MHRTPGALAPPGKKTQRQQEGLAALVSLAQATAPTAVWSWTGDAARAMTAPSSGPSSSFGRGRLARALPLSAVLIVQAVLSLRLVWSNTAFSDEGLYLWSGHLEWTHWLYGTRIPQFPTYFSGAPVVYPPLAALADTFGGLAAARLLSLAFMLGATALLYSLTRRIFGRWPAVLAATLFAGTGSAEFLGAFATYDAMALFLLAAATWIGAHASERIRAGFILWVFSGTLLFLADAAKYAAALFDPVVVLAVGALAWHHKGLRQGILGTVITTCTTWALMIGALVLGGPSYLRGIAFTTLSRSAGKSSATGILYVSAGWVGIIALLTIIGAVTLTFVGRRPMKVLGWTLALAILLAPIEQARIHVFTSLFKHVGYGAWFASVIAGYAISALAHAVPPAKSLSARKVGAVTTVIAAVPGILLAGAHFQGWPSTQPLIATLRPILKQHPGPVFADEGDVVKYYFGGSLNPFAVIDDAYFAYTNPQTGQRLTQPVPALAEAVKNRYFAEIVLAPGNGSTYAPQVRSDLAKYGGYRLVAAIPYGIYNGNGHFYIWTRQSGS